MRLSAVAISATLLDAGRRLLWAAAAAVFTLLLFSVFRIPSVPAFVSTALFALAAATIWRPAAALAVVALLVPIAAWTGRTWNGSVGWPEVVVVAFLAGYAGRQTFTRRVQPSGGQVLAIHTMVAIVAASITVQLLLLNSTVGLDALESRIAEMVSVEYFVGQVGFEGTHAGMRLIEGLLLAHAGQSLARLDVSFAPLILRVAVAAAAIASSLNLWRVWLGALRLESPLTAFLHYLTTIRFNTHYADVNAAGSYFAMTLLAALGLSREGRGWPWALMAGAITLSLILSGSRTAVVAALTAVALVGWLRSRPKSAVRAAWSPGARVAAAVLLLAAFAGLYLLLVRNITPSTLALRIRAEFASISLHMLATRPLFGVGIGQFPARLEEFASPALMAVYPKAQENAHNNFLQILAELGTVGFAAFICVLVAFAAPIVRFLRQGPSSPTNAGAISGLFAFVLTWIGGHPLLIAAPSASFWLLLGVFAGYASVRTLVDPAGERATRSRWQIPSRAARGAAAVVILCAAGSVPIRARQALGIANLEHTGIGVSAWQTSGEEVPYRFVGLKSTVFAPSAARAVELPLRSAVPERDLQVEIYVDGRLADAIVVPADTWRTLNLQLPNRDDRRRFRAVELRVRNPPLDRDAELLMVGKVRPHW